MVPKKDTQLTTLEELTDRINSIDRQRETLNAADPNKGDWRKRHEKICQLTERHDKLWTKRALLLKAKCNTEKL